MFRIAPPAAVATRHRRSLYWAAERRRLAALHSQLVCVRSMLFHPARRLCVTALAAVWLVLAACGAPVTQTVAANPPPDVQIRPAGTCELPTCQPFQLTLADFKMDPARISVQAPTVRFVLTNVGTFTHAFEISGEDGDRRSSNIGPGKTGYLEVSFGPGTYEAICPILGHAVRGQRATIRVSQPA